MKEFNLCDQRNVQKTLL